jgi:glycosyltransferase involved in cell wall biosynthesis
MTRILLFSDRNGIYGAERINQELAFAFKKAGYEVTLAIPSGDNALTRTIEQAGIHRYDLPLENIYDSTRPAPSLSEGLPAEKCFESVKPDLILFCDGFPFASLAAKRVAIERKLPYVTVIHSVNLAWSRDFAPFLASLQQAFDGAKQIVAVSQDNLDLLRNHYGLKPSQGMVIHAGRPAEYFEPAEEGLRQRMRQSLEIPDEAVVAITIGRFDHEKGYDLLLDCIPILSKDPHWKSLRMIWVGDGHLRRRAEQLARLLAGSHIRLLGERNDIADLLEASDFLLLPSRHEGLPLVLLEAMAKGRPVIGTQVGGIPEAIVQCGRILPHPDSPGFKHQLANAILELVRNKEDRWNLGHMARLRALNHFTHARMIKDWMNLVQLALSTS